MTQRKFREVTRGGYWIENIQPMKPEGDYVLTGMVGNHSSQPPSDDPLNWHTETFTAEGAHRIGNDQSPFDLIEEPENE